MRVMGVSNRYALRELKPEGRKHATRTGTALPRFALKVKEPKSVGSNVAAAHASREEVELCILQEHDSLPVPDLAARNSANGIFQL